MINRTQLILASSIESPCYPQPTLDLAYLDSHRQFNLSPSTASDATLLGDRSRSTPSTTEPSPPQGNGRKSTSRQPSKLRDDAQVTAAATPMAATEVNGTTNSADANAAAARPKRVRTGCLTCRERHLKCDEGLPQCQNCRKSSRICKRGVKLNFIDTQVQNPPTTLPPTHDWQVNFQDESREIASEYKGGLGRYAALEHEDLAEVKEESNFDFSASMVGAPTMAHQTLPPIQAYPETTTAMSDSTSETQHRHSLSTSDTSYSNTTIPPAPQSSYSNPEQTLTPPNETRDYLDSPEEVLLMQVYVEEVGLWMDSMDPYKHV